MKEDTDLWLQVIQEMEGRRQKGLETYGRPVTADECVDWLTHATEEFWDGGIYCKAAREVFVKLQNRVKELEQENERLRYKIYELEGN